MAGLDLTHVPYRGAGPMLTDLLGGQVQVAFPDIGSSLQHVRSGKLRALAGAGPTGGRSAALPERTRLRGKQLVGYRGSNSGRERASRGRLSRLTARASASQVRGSARLVASVASSLVTVQGSVPSRLAPGSLGYASFGSGLGARVHFWPFDGWEIPAGGSAIAEVYPRLWSRGFSPETAR